MAAVGRVTLFRPRRTCATCGRRVRQPKAGEQTARCYGNPKYWPARPHEGPWTTEADRERWDQWRATREELDAHRPREYVIDGAAIRDAEGLGTAVDEALFGPGPPWDGFNGDGVSDWIDVVWPRDSVLVWTDHQISKEAMSEPAPGWDDTDFGMITHILDVREIPYRLE